MVAAATPPNVTSLPTGSLLVAGQALVSPTGAFSWIMQGDGNLVLYTATNAVLWSSGTYGHPGAYLANQGDGNLVVYSPTNAPLWWSNHFTTAQTVVVAQSDGNVVQYAGSTPIWYTGTAGHDININGGGRLAPYQWDDNVTLGAPNNGFVSQGNVVGVWQGVLWTDHDEVDGEGSPPINNCDVDGYFGNRTYLGTEWFQYYAAGYNVGADGIVGYNTWHKAGYNFLTQSGGMMIYRGEYGALYFTEDATHDFYWSWNNSPYYYTGYTAINLWQSTTGCHQAP